MYESDSILVHFFKSRKSENSRENATKILEYLSQEKNKGNWIRLKLIKDALVPDTIKDPTAFQRTINALESFGIIEKKIDEEWKESGRKPVYYCYNEKFNPVSFIPREILEGMAENGSKATHALKILAGRLSAAYEIMSEAGIKNPDELVNIRYEEIKEIDLTPFSYTDEDLKKWPLGAFGITRLYPSITFIPQKP